MLTKEELAARRDKIGGSDAAAILGEDPHKTAYAVALRIRGEIESDDLDGLDHIEFGNEMEGVLARFYERKEKVRVYKPEQIIHKKHPFLAVNIDRLREDRMEIGIECKNTGLYGVETWGETGTDEVPMRVLLQCQHAMMVAPVLQEFHVLRCYGGNTYQKYIVPRSDALISDLEALEIEFYENVKAGNLPAPDWGHRTTKDLIKKAFRNIVGEIQPMPALDGLTHEWEQVCAERLAAKKREDALKNQIEHLMGEHEAGRLSDGRVWRRRKISRKGYVVEPTSYIECRLLKG